MTDISKIEERLFLLLDTVEKQAEENTQQQKITAELTKKIDTKLDTLTDDVDDKIHITQQRFDNLVFTSVKRILEKELAECVTEVIIEQVDFKPIAKSLDNAVKDLNKQINSKSSLYETLHKSNMQKTKELADALEYQKDSVAKEHYKLIGIVSASVFFVMCVFFAIIYFMTVPTSARLESLRQDKAQLIADINQLKRNRAEWIKDASKNGYLKR